MDIDFLYDWATKNKMKFHPKKCKVVSICNKNSPLGMLPFVVYHYSIGGSPLSYVDSEKDLGVNVNPSFSFNDHCELLLAKANQKFGLVKRTCHFVKDIKRRRALYLSLVRSQFEHCSPVWRPSGSTLTAKFETFQRKCIKWILSEEETSYSSHDTYIRKSRQTNVPPLAIRFIVNDLILFHKVFYKYIPLDIPDYLKLFDGNTRLRSCHLDQLSFVSSLTPKGSSTNNLEKSFFYRTHMIWNNLPFELRDISSKSEFRSKVEAHLWSTIISNSSDENWGDFGLPDT